MERELRIVLCSSFGGEGRGAVLEVTDAASGTIMLRARMTLAEAGSVVLGSSTAVRGYVSDALERIGKRLEVRRVEFDMPPRVEFNSDRSDAARRLAVAVAHLETDGWWADTGQFVRSQTEYANSGRPLMTLVRWVPDETARAEQPKGGDSC